MVRGPPMRIAAVLHGLVACGCLSALAGCQTDDLLPVGEAESAVGEATGGAVFGLREGDHYMSGNASLDVRHYRLAIDATRRTMTATSCGKLGIDATVTVAARRAVDTLDLHFNPNGVTGLVVSDAETGAPYAHSVHALRGGAHKFIAVAPGRTLGEGETVKVRFQYELDTLRSGMPGGGYFAPFSCSGSAAQGSLAFQSYAYNFRSLVPSNDYLQDAATNELVITTTPGTAAAANGKLLAGDWAAGADGPDGTRVFHWLQEQPISTSVMTFILRPATAVRFEGMYDERVPMVTWAPGVVAFSRIPTAIRQFETYLGPYPFDKIGVQGGGGMEYASLVQADTQNQAHEMAHQWWGNTVRPETFGDGWISEGFTTYYEHLAAGDQVNLDRLFRPCPCRKVDAPFTQMNLLYDEGAQVLQALRRVVNGFTGEPTTTNGPQQTFFLFLKTYYVEHQGQTVSSRGFVAFVRARIGPFLAERGVTFDPALLGSRLDAWQSQHFTF